MSPVSIISELLSQKVYSVTVTQTQVCIEFTGTGDRLLITARIENHDGKSSPYAKLDVEVDPA
jgi:hypothetical protein